MPLPGRKVEFKLDSIDGGFLKNPDVVEETEI